MFANFRKIKKTSNSLLKVLKIHFANVTIIIIINGFWQIAEAESKQHIKMSSKYCIVHNYISLF